MTAHLLTVSFMALMVARQPSAGSPNPPLARGIPGGSPSQQPLNQTAAPSIVDPKPVPEHPGARAVGKVPAGYTQVAQTDSGRKLVARLPKVQSVQAALRSAFKDLGTHFDAAPRAQTAFEDTKSHRWGGAPFEAKINGQPVKGLLLASVADQGADIMVAYCRADAPASEWAKLRAEAPNGSTGAGPGAVPRTREYRFPDGTGSIQIPEGWKTSAQTAIQGISIYGPEGQIVSIGQTVPVCTPDSMAVQTQLQLEAQARQMGFPPPKPLNLLVAPFAGPGEALPGLMPQMSQMSLRNGGPALRLERMLADPGPVPSSFPGGQAASLYFALSRTKNGQSVLYRSRCNMESWPVGPGAWSLTWTELAAPDQIFERDLPIMAAIVTSLKTDPRAMQRETGRAIQAMNRRFEAYQRAHATRVQAFDDYFQAQQRNSIIRDRVAADFDEVIRGQRTVEDTRTGQRHSVDLGNVTEIVEELNRPDPGRFVEIPLRDEVAPLPPAR